MELIRGNWECPGCGESHEDDEGSNTHCRNCGLVVNTGYPDTATQGARLNPVSREHYLHVSTRYCGCDACNAKKVIEGEFAVNIVMEEPIAPEVMEAIVKRCMRAIQHYYANVGITPDDCQIGIAHLRGVYKDEIFEIT